MTVKAQGDARSPQLSFNTDIGRLQESDLPAEMQKASQSQTSGFSLPALRLGKRQTKVSLFLWL